MKLRLLVIGLVASLSCLAQESPDLQTVQANAQAGQADAQFALAFRYLDGQGRDYKKAAEWFKRAALQGDARAQLELGVMYVNGEGMPADRREAYAYYWLASQQGNNQATEYLKDLERNMPTVQIRLAKARAEQLAKEIKPEATEDRKHLHSPRPADQVEPAPTPAPASPSEPSSVAQKAAPPGTLRFGVLSVRDPQVNNHEAFSLLVPTGWQNEGGIVWRHDLSNLASANMRVFDPEKRLTLQLFPLMPYTWSEEGIPFFPEGKIYLGNEVRPPTASASEYVYRYLLPLYGQFQPRIVNTAPLPEVAQAVAQASQEPGMQKRVSAERVRVEFDQEGQAMEADVFCVVVYAQSTTYTGTTFWGPQRLYAFMAPKGQLDRQMPVFQTMANSVKINPIWFDQYLQVVKMWQQGQMQAIRRAGELSRHIARTYDEIREINRQAYENQQASSDRVNAQFSKALRGVEAYQDPVAERRVELPSEYEYAWVSGTGEYLLSNEAGFDPNVGSTQDWRLMKTTQ